MRRTLREVQVDTQHARYDFLIADLEVCDTFAALVETELAVGEPDPAQLVLVQAEARYATIGRFFRKLQNADERKEIEAKLNQLRDRLDALGPEVARMTRLIAAKSPAPRFHWYDPVPNTHPGVHVSFPKIKAARGGKHLCGGYSHPRRGRHSEQPARVILPALPF